VPLLYRAYNGNGSDQAVLEDCLEGLSELHTALDAGEGRTKPGQRTLVRDGGFWSPQLELHLDVVGYYSLISLPLGHTAAKAALDYAAQKGAMKKLSGQYKDVRAARLRTKVGQLDRTLIVVESQTLLEGQKRGIAARLGKAKQELVILEGLVQAKRIRRSMLEQRVHKTLSREHLASFVMVDIGGDEAAPTLSWHVDDVRRHTLETTRLGRRVLCTDRHTWSMERIVHAFRGQWNVEELFRRSKKGGVVPWGPSHQWTDGSLRLHTFATVLGLMLVSLAKLALGTDLSARAMMDSLAAIEATELRVPLQGKGRPHTVLLAPTLTPEQGRAVRIFELERWLPSLSSAMPRRAGKSTERAVS
jgi:transposase